MLMVVGNWKMNLGTQQIYDLVTAISRVKTSNHIVLCPAFPYLPFVTHLTALTDIAVGGQTCSAFEQGAYTGDVSAAMLRDVGCQYVILGHSERRHHFAECDALIQKKIEQAYKQGLKVIYCIGETLEQRNANQTMSVIKTQLEQGLPKTANKDNTIIAYEPVWAIGTGYAATFQEIEDISAQLKKWYNFKLLYGGSVNAENAQELSCIEDLDGFLIGGASIKADAFTKIIEII